MLSEKNEIARSIRETGHKIMAVINSGDQSVNMDGFSQVSFFRVVKPRWMNKILYHLKMLTVALFDDYDIALFGVHSSHLIPILKIAARFRRSKPGLILDIRTVPVDLSNNIRSKIVSIRYNTSIKIADLFCDGITCITPMLGSTIEPKLRKFKKKIGYFQTGVNFRIFDPSKALSLKKSFGLENRFIVIYHGVLSPNRGLQDTLNAIAICKQQISNILFMIVGTGAGESELKNLAHDLKIEKSVFFTGGVPFEEVPNYLKTADVGIIPLPQIEWWNVSSPIKLKEYLAMQLPVIATDIPAHRFVVKKAGGTTLINNNEPACIAQAILAFYKNRQTTYPMKTRNELYEIISYNSQAMKFIDYVASLKI
jgi:glycosyltransferase involved in cell wall biosynthesis